MAELSPYQVALRNIKTHTTMSPGSIDMFDASFLIAIAFNKQKEDVLNDYLNLPKEN
jgi:hypothetical protein